MFRFKKTISAFLCIVLLFGMALPAFAVDINTPETAVKLTLDKKQTVNISRGGGKVYFTFTPDKTAVYEFISVSKGVDPCGYLYNSSMKQLVFNDDVAEEMDFSVVYRLNKGEKYYFAASLYDSKKTGSFEVMLRSYDGIFIESHTGDINVKPDDNVVLSVNAYSNAGGLFYQWELEYRAQGKSGGYNWVRRELQNSSSNTLTINKATTSGNINCIITDNDGNLEEVWFGYHVNAGLKASIVGNEFRSVPAGGTETLSVKASVEKGSVHYQWYKQYKLNDNGGEDGWKKEIVSGETLSSLTLKNADSPANYQCLVYDDYGNFEEIWFYVSINSGLTAAAVGHTERSVKAGGNDTLSVNATVNKGKLHYQWYKKYRVYDDYGYNYETEKIASGTSASLSLKNITWTADYVCLVSDDYGNSKDIWFYVTVNSGFNISTPDTTNLTVGNGVRATLSVKASGTGLTYRWGSYFFDDDSELGDTTKAQFITPAIYDFTEFYCAVMDAHGNAKKVWFYISTDSKITHSFGEPTWTWSSDHSSATAKFVCKSESAHIETVNAKVTKTTPSEPNCTKSGSAVYTASATFHGKTYTNKKEFTVPALGHSWDNGTKTIAPTTAEEGVMTYTCTVCGIQRTESIPKLPSAGTTPTPKPQKFALGDIDKDGVITTKDARLALRAAVGLENFNAEQMALADINYDNKITTSDARMILRAAVGLEKLN